MKRKNSNAAAYRHTEDLRILILLSYFILLGAIIVAANSIFAKNVQQIYNTILYYFAACAVKDTGSNCGAIKEDLETLATPGVWITFQICLGAYPGVQLLYVVNFGDILRKCLLHVRCKKPSTPTQ